MISDGIDAEAIPLAYDVFESDDTQTDTHPIVLTHGLFWNKYMFKELGHRLNKETKRKVYTIDLRNHDQSPFCQRCDSKIMTEDVKRFLRDHDLKKVTFISHSFSSSIAYLIALEKPECVDKIVMIDCPPFSKFNEKMMKEHVLPQFTSQDRFLRTLDKTLPLVDAKRKILSLIPQATKAQEYFLKKVAYDLDKVGNTFRWKTDIKFLMDRYSEQAFSVKPIGCINHDVLIVRCVDSVRVPDWIFKESLKYCPNAKLETMEDTTHLLMFEKLEQFTKIVKDFMNS